MPNYQFSIITPNGEIFNNTIDSLTATGAQGSFGVLANHASMVTAVQPGIVKVHFNKKDAFFKVSVGILEVNQKSNVMLLADSAKQVEPSTDLKENVA